MATSRPVRVMTGDDTTTLSLAQAARGGDPDAFTELYRRHVRFVHTLLLAYAPPDDVPDLVQETFFTAWSQVGGLRDAYAFSGWLTTIARNVGRMHGRAQRDLVALPSELPSPDTAPDSALDADRALSMISQLPAKLREPLLLRLVEGMNGEEIAAHLDMTHAAVRVNLHRGMQRIRELLEFPNA